MDPSLVGKKHQDAPSWSKDGVLVAYVEGTPGGTWALVKATTSDGVVRQVLNTNVVPLSRTAWSRDGKWILFSSLEGLAVISPEGDGLKVISQDSSWVVYGFTDDNKTIFGLR